MISNNNTPGTTGLPGKCPGKNGSLIVIFLIAPTFFPGSKMCKTFINQ